MSEEQIMLILEMHLDFLHQNSCIEHTVYRIIKYIFFLQFTCYSISIKYFFTYSSMILESGLYQTFNWDLHFKDLGSIP